MSLLTPEQMSGKVLDHLGLVAATIKKSGLVEKIDKRLPISHEKGAKVSIGQRVAAMILNGLGFMDDRLYLFPQFLANKPVDKLLGADVCAEDFNDDVLGRGLDALYKYGITQLFSEVAFEVGTEQQLLGRSAHGDTSSLSVYGAYEDIEPEDDKSKVKPAQPRHGYSKDHRPGKM